MLPNVCPNVNLKMQKYFSETASGFQAQLCSWNTVSYVHGNKSQLWHIVPKLLKIRDKWKNEWNVWKITCSLISSPYLPIEYCVCNILLQSINYNVLFFNGSSFIFVASFCASSFDGSICYCHFQFPMFSVYCLQSCVWLHDTIKKLEIFNVFLATDVLYTGFFYFIFSLFGRM